LLVAVVEAVGQHRLLFVVLEAVVLVVSVLALAFL